MNYTALHTYIATDPDSLGLTSATRSEKTAILNTPGNRLSTAKTWTKTVAQVPVANVLAWAAAGPLAKITDASNDTNNAARSIALAALKIFSGAFTIYDASDPTNQALLAALVSAGLCTQDQANALPVLPASAAENLLGSGTVLTDQDIERAGF